MKKCNLKFKEDHKKTLPLSLALLGPLSDNDVVAVK